MLLRVRNFNEKTHQFVSHHGSIIDFRRTPTLAGVAAPESLNAMEREREREWICRAAMGTRRLGGVPTRPPRSHNREAWVSFDQAYRDLAILKHRGPTGSLRRLAADPFPLYYLHLASLRLDSLSLVAYYKGEYLETSPIQVSHTEY